VPTVKLTTRVNAPVERCFDLYRSVSLHVDSYQHAHEQAVGTITAGLVGPGDVAAFRMRAFGFPYRMSVKVVAYDRPRHFRDSQTEGFFLRADHDHHFAVEDGTTVVTDVFDYTPRFSWLGTLLDRLILARYVRWTIGQKNANVKRVAEGGEWKRYLPAG
jgi:ligand-binding SRPBCC domain-containing protein